MATNNIVNAPFPLSATQGGLGLASPTAHGILLGQGASAVTPLVLGAGQLPIGTTAGDPAAASLTAGSNISITSSTGSITITATGMAGNSWNFVSGSTQTVAVNQSYVNQNSGLTTFTIPATFAAGSIFEIAGQGAGGWTLVYQTGQSIIFGNQTTTTTSGSLSSTLNSDSVYILCLTANTLFKAIYTAGNLTVA